MPAKSTKSVKNAASIRLPPLRKLKVRRPDSTAVNPCVAIMSSVLTCWASAGHTTAGCAEIENQLRRCMDGPANLSQKKNSINYHLSRLYPKIIGPHKRK
ncbi:MAG: hypothetical protein M1825_003959 [Sarcosagium campestre]|nr:MAG: hypothetical protein M1825_003959 [Sarcosagium campestre]